MKLAIVTGVWKRPEVFEIFARGIKELYQFKDIEIVTIVAGSETDRSKKMVLKHGFTYIEIKNNPLATKMNATLTVAKQIEADYVLCLGSDDIIHPELMAKYIELMKQGFDFIGVLDFYFYDTKSKRAAYWGGYRDSKRTNHTCGAGRIISKRLLDKLDWKIWENQQSHMLDNSFQDKLKATQHSSCVFSLVDYGLYGLDIKSSTNMTPFKLWDNTNYIEKNVIFEKFSYLQLNERNIR